jgi:hypothetical protein
MRTPVFIGQAGETRAWKTPALVMQQARQGRGKRQELSESRALVSFPDDMSQTCYERDSE